MDREPIKAHDETLLRLDKANAAMQLSSVKRNISVHHNQVAIDLSGLMDWTWFIEPGWQVQAG